MDEFWKNVDECLDKVEKATTVDEVMTILGEYFAPSSTEAFFGGSGGDRQLRESLLPENGWRYVWAEAHYYWTAEDRNGDRLTYIEGDVTRGDR